jgi:hypothetical protein
MQTYLDAVVSATIHGSLFVHPAPHPTPPRHVQVENRLQIEGQRIPNLTHPQVPISNDEDAATVLSLVSQSSLERK